MRTFSRWILVSAVFLLPASLAAQVPVNPVWTAVASTGTVDEQNFNPAVNFNFTGPALLFAAGSINPPVVARYNVTNLAGVNNPTWTFLELGALDTSAVAGNQVVARLIRVRPCDGSQAILCTVVSTETTTGAGVCTRCQFTAPIDFTQFLYYVEVTIQRTTPNAQEQALTLRLF